MTIQPHGILRFFTGVAIFIGFPPLAWHIRSPTKNIPIIILILWTLFQNIIKLVNSFIWFSDAELSDSWNGDIYCDIVIKLDIVAKAGQLACVVAIMRTIGKMLRPRQKPLRTTQLRKSQWNDFTICLTIPLVMGAVHFLIQPARYDIYTITGCSPIVDNSLPSFLLLFIWPPILAVVSSGYAVYILYRLYRWRVNKKARTYNSAVVWRLFIMSISVLLLLFPLIMSTFIGYCKVELLPYNWGLIHGIEWNYIIKYPTGDKVEFSDFISVITACIIFGAYGVNGEAWNMYRVWAEKLHLEKLYESRSVLGGSASEKWWKLRRQTTSSTAQEQMESGDWKPRAEIEVSIVEHFKIKLERVSGFFSNWCRSSSFTQDLEYGNRERTSSLSSAKSDKSRDSITKRAADILGV